MEATEAAFTPHTQERRKGREGIFFFFVVGEEGQGRKLEVWGENCACGCLLRMWVVEAERREESRKKGQGVSFPLFFLGRGGRREGKA